MSDESPARPGKKQSNDSFNLEVALALLPDEYLPQFMRNGGFELMSAEYGMKRVIKALGDSRVIHAIGVDTVVEFIGPAKFVETFGIQRLIELVGLEAALASIPTDAIREYLNRKEGQP